MKESGRRSRRDRPPRLYQTRRFRIGAVLALFAALILVNGFIIWLQSPHRRQYHFYEDGLAAYSRRDYSRAAIQFERFLEIQPGARRARYNLGLCRFMLGEEAKGVLELQAVARDHPGFDLAHLALAEYFLATGDFRLARKSATDAIGRPPVPARAYTILAEVKIGLGDSDGAIDALRRALSLGFEKVEDQVEPNLKLGDLYLAREYLGIPGMSEGLAKSRYERARELAQGIVDARPGHVKARIWLVKARAGLGEFDRAEEELRQVIRERPEDPEHPLLLARIILSGGEEDRYEKAGRVLEEAWGVTPSPGIATEWARVVARGPGSDQRGIEILTDAVARFPDERGLRVTLVDRLIAAGRTEEARKAMAETVSKFPGQADVIEAEGDLLAATGDMDGALAAFESAVEVRPQSANARRKVIQLLLPRVLESMSAGVSRPPERERLEENLAFFLDPERGINPSDVRARGWQARLKFAEGDFKAAADLLGGEGRIRPNSWIGLRVLGASRLRGGEYWDASKALYDALIHPDSPGTAEEYELAYTATYRVGHHEREVTIAERAVSKWPDDPEWRLRLARAYARDDKPDLALSTCEAARRMVEGTNDVRGMLLAARIHQKRGEIGRARTLLEEATLVRRDAETRGALYAFFAETGDAKLAEQGFKALVDENPDDPDALLRFGDYLHTRKDDEGALAQYGKALELSPGNAEVIRRLAELRIARAASEEDAISIAAEAVAMITEANAEDPHALYFRGKLHLLRGEWKEAVSALGAYFERNPYDAAGAYYLAVAHRRSGDLTAARDGFLAALSISPDMTEAKLELATLYFTEGLRARWRGDTTSAYEAFRKVTDLDPEEPNTRRFLAETLASLGRLDEAAKEAERVLATDPDDAGALFVTALHMAGSGEFAAAEKRFARLVAVLPDNYRGHLYLGLALAEQRRFEEARVSLRTAWQLSPGANDALHAIALLELLAGNPDEAVRFVQAEIDRRGDDAFAQHLLADLFRETGRTDDAIRAYRRAFELSNDDTVALAMAAALVADGGDLEEAVRLLSAGEAVTKSPAPLRAVRGRMLFALGKRKEAELAFREALADGSAGALRELGLLCLDTDRLTEGIDLLDRAVAAGLVDPTVFFRLGLAATEQGDLGRAEAEYRRVLVLVPEDPATLNNLALVLSRIESKREEAVRIARRAFEKMPDSAAVADTLGWVLYRAKKYEEAARILKPVAARSPKDAVAHYHAGLACFRAYLWEEARPLLRRALELDPESGEAEEARKALEEMG